MAAIVAPILLLLGFAIYVIGLLWFLVAAFRESVLWGVACLFLPIVQLFFLIIHWQAAKKPFGLQILGVVLFIAAIIIVNIFSPQPVHR